LQAHETNENFFLILRVSRKTVTLDWV